MQRITDFTIKKWISVRLYLKQWIDNNSKDKEPGKLKEEFEHTKEKCDGIFWLTKRNWNKRNKTQWWCKVSIITYLDS